jgi:Uma2 family endonuclease
MTTKLPPPYPGRGGMPLPEELHLPSDDRSVIPDPDAPDDWEPLPDAMQQEPHYLDAVTVAAHHFLDQPGVLAAGNCPVYYTAENGGQRIFRPDLLVAFGVNPITIRQRNGYFISRVEKPPDFILEIASVSTFRNDLGPKRNLYARLGVEEYWRFDATTVYYPEPLAGERLQDGIYSPLPVSRDLDGIIRGYSPLLGLFLCWDQADLRFFDPATGEFLRTLNESESALFAERIGREAAEHRADALEDRAATDQARIRSLEEELGRRQADS